MRQVTVFELACTYILIIRLRQVAFEAVQHTCAFANCKACAFEMDDAELLLLFVYAFSLFVYSFIHSCIDSIVLMIVSVVVIVIDNYCLSCQVEPASQPANDLSACEKLSR